MNEIHTLVWHTISPFQDFIINQFFVYIIINIINSYYYKYMIRTMCTGNNNETPNIDQSFDNNMKIERSLW